MKLVTDVSLAPMTPPEEPSYWLSSLGKTAEAVKLVVQATRVQQDMQYRLSAWKSQSNCAIR